MNKHVITTLTLILLSFSAVAEEYFINTSHKTCKHGLHEQPDFGPFSIFVFCDDAMGSNIGIINATPGAGPGGIDLGPTKEWPNWYVNNRFWQESGWATDTTAVVWSKDLKSLYVPTSPIYGTGNLYKLNLVEKKAAILIPNTTVELSPKHSHSTKILSVNPDTGDITVKLEFYNTATKKKDVRKYVVK